MATDESFKKQGSVPFKWEIKPGVPKQQHNKQPKPPPMKLRPPPSAEQRMISSLSRPRARSELAEVVSLGCFQASSLMKRKPSVKKSNDDRYADFDAELSSRLFVSSRNVVPPFRESVAMSFCGSSDSSSSSPRTESDSEWAGFGLF